ncbi:MAG: MotB family protein [Hyphomicrobiales bacterium]|nr:MAG: MotB family protein [Hyphomicrobiales bacterium]
MSKEGEEETKAPELLIIKRGGGHGEEGHHGGVWKIAYADFMTAMMAFFLVMWLINSSDKKTLTQVATYFNPLRLTDKSAASKGLHEAHSVESTAQGDEVQSSGSTQGAKKEKSKKEKETKGDPKGTYNEEAIFQDPLAMLDKLANDAKEAAAQATHPEQRSDATPASTNAEQVRDPFDPGFRQQIEVIKKGDKGEGTGPHPEKSEGGTAGDLPDRSKQGGAEGVGPGRGGIGDIVEKKLGAGDKDGQKQAKALPPPPPPSKPEQKTEPANKEEQVVAAATAVARKMEQEIKTSIAGTGLGSVPNIEVTYTEEGILVSVTDDYDFGMFSVSSAEPSPNLVLVMEKLAAVLSKQPEQLVVRGHTDGRPYRGGKYDNWRLSTARAHMAYYMLVRGGVDEKRFEKVEGYADKRLKVTQDPMAAPNRRIEILLRKPR